MSELNVEIKHDEETHENGFFSRELDEVYAKHLEETNLDADVWEVWINGEHIISGLFPLAYAELLVKEEMSDEN